MIFKGGLLNYKMNTYILYFTKEILNEKVKDKLKELLPDAMQQQIFITSLYDIAVNEYVVDENIKEILKKNKEKINFTTFKTLTDLANH